MPRAAEPALRFWKPLAEADVVKLQATENTWGRHPECPVEVLDDGSQVWRVPPGATVQMVISDSYSYPVTLLDERPPVAASGYVRVRRTTGSESWARWDELRRLDYRQPEAG